MSGALPKLAFSLLMGFGAVQNLLQNPSFEEVGDDGLPIGWRADAWREGASFGVSKEARSGRFSAFIRCPERNDARLIQRVKLKPHSVYRLSAWVRTEDVRVAEKGGDVGANIGVYGTFVKSEDVKGTTGWKEISTIVFTTDEPCLEIALRLGFWGSTCVGKAWFDDVRLTPIPMARVRLGDERWREKLKWAAEREGFASFEGRHVILRLRAERLRWLSNPFEWLEKLDAAYEAYAELVGGVPFGGKPVIIQEVEDYPGGLAVAGYPILWFGRYIDKPTFRRIEEGDWLFGILHEMGHVFDLDGRWAWNGEFFANFKMVYVADRCGAKIWHWGRWYDHGSKEGKRLDDFYKEMARREGELERINSEDWPDHYTDPDTYHFCALKGIIGWEPFKKTFRAFLKMPASKVPKKPLEKYRLFVKLLDKFSGFDCSGWLAKRGFPKVR